MSQAMRKIIHVDMDAFYVSVEIRDSPELEGKPVAVGGKLNTRGVLSTCNYIAREYGVRSAMPTSVALRKCPDLILVPGRMQVYKSVSKQIHEIFRRYTSLIEPLSLDEAYLDVTDCQRCHGSATLIAREICQAIYDELGLTASAGVAPIKYLAKVASDINKPNGIFVITPGEVDNFIDQMPLNKIPGVGKVTYERLSAKGLVKGSDIKQYSEIYMVGEYGRLGKMLWDRCSGQDSRRVVTSRQRKSVGVERTFPEDISDLAQLKELLFTRIVPELRKRSEGHLKCRSIQKLGVKVKFSDFQQTTKEFACSVFDNSVFERLLDEAVDRGNGKQVRLLGAHIGLSNEPDGVVQYEFDW